MFTHNSKHEKAVESRLEEIQESGEMDSALEDAVQEEESLDESRRVLLNFWWWTSFPVLLLCLLLILPTYWGIGVAAATAVCFAVFYLKSNAFKARLDRASNIFVERSVRKRLVQIKKENERAEGMKSGKPAGQAKGASGKRAS